MKKLYTCNAIKKLIDLYVFRGGNVYTIEEGVLGYGLTVLAGENLKTVVIKEVYLNEWSSAHTIRFYTNIPKKYAAIIENM